MSPRASRLLAGGLFFFSGAAALGFQIVWTKQFGLGLGHEAPAMLAVVAAFLGGMALGAAALDRMIARSARPGRWVAGLEVVIGLWGAALAAGMPILNAAALRWIGVDPSPARHWVIAFAVPGLALLPATVAMGATLPAMERVAAPWFSERRCVGALYAANTLGAVLGALASAFVLAPAFGFRVTTLLFAAINCVCAAVAWPWVGRLRFEVQSPKPRQIARTGSPPPELSTARLLFTAWLTGLLGIGYEVLGVRALAQVLENTVYTFAAVLAVYLLGTAAGAALFQRFGGAHAIRRSLTRKLIFLSTACLLGVATLPQIERVYLACRRAWGESVLATMAAEMTVAALLLAAPTILMGATFSHLVQLARRDTGGVGRAAGWNTFGGALAPLFFGVMLLPAMGSKWALIVVALGYLVLLPSWRSGLLALPVGLALMLAFVVRSPETTKAPGERLVAQREGVMATVSVTENAGGQRTLRVNQRFQMGGTGTASAEQRQTHIPLLLHPQPRRALFLGVGTGISFGAAGLHEGVEADGVELLPEVAEAMPHFEPHNGPPGNFRQLKLHLADARRFVRATPARYDVIVADLFHPAMDGVGALYTREHFAAIRARLVDGGLFCQWLPLYQLDEWTLHIITRTLVDVFPETHVFLLRFNLDTPVLGLIGAVQPLRLTARSVERRIGSGLLRDALKRVVLTDSIQLLGCYVAGPKELATFAASAPLNTDDHPRVMFEAPRASFRRDFDPGRFLLSLLERWPSDPAAVISVDGETSALVERVRAFVRARDLYLRGLAVEANGNVPQSLDAYVESCQASADFTWSYARCFGVANALSQADAPGARRLLERLIAARPEQTLARDFLNRLGSPP